MTACHISDGRGGIHHENGCQSDTARQSGFLSPTSEVAATPGGRGTDRERETPDTASQSSARAAGESVKTADRKREDR